MNSVTILLYVLGIGLAFAIAGRLAKIKPMAILGWILFCVALLGMTFSIISGEPGSNNKSTKGKAKNILKTTKGPAKERLRFVFVVPSQKLNLSVKGRHTVGTHDSEKAYVYRTILGEVNPVAGDIVFSNTYGVDEIQLESKKKFFPMFFVVTDKLKT